MFNLSMAVKETGRDILFLRKVIEGASNNSYGIHVAKLAGVPSEVIDRANDLLNYVEGNKKREESIPTKKIKKLYSNELFPGEELILDAIKGLNYNKITPLEALNFISKWQKELND